VVVVVVVVVVVLVVVVVVVSSSSSCSSSHGLLGPCALARCPGHDMAVHVRDGDAGGQHTPPRAEPHETDRDTDGHDWMHGVER